MPFPFLDVRMFEIVILAVEASAAAEDEAAEEALGMEGRGAVADMKGMACRADEAEIPE